jgi:hypothetical protein
VSQTVSIHPASVSTSVFEILADRHRRRNDKSPGGAVFA